MKTSKQKTETIQKVFFILVVLLTVPIIHAFAGPGAPGGGADAGAPIDGGLSLLVAAGVGYGVKKVRAARKKTLQDSGETKSVAEV